MKTEKTAMPPSNSGSMPDEMEAKARELATQDNQITSDPIFLVQERRRFYGVDPDYCETRAYVNAEDAEPVTQAEHPERFARFAAGQFDDNEDGGADMWTLTGYLDRWEFVQPFLTAEAAELFRRREAHNHGETRVYVDSGYRNPEWRWLRAHVAGCAAALRSARAEAFEEAARVAGEAARRVAQGNCAEDCSCHWQECADKYQRGIEDALRSKAKP